MTTRPITSDSTATRRHTLYIQPPLFSKSSPRIPQSVAHSGATCLDYCCWACARGPLLQTTSIRGNQKPWSKPPPSSSVFRTAALPLCLLTKRNALGLLVRHRYRSSVPCPPARLPACIAVPISTKSLRCWPLRRIESHSPSAIPSHPPRPNVAESRDIDVLGHPFLLS